MKTIWRIKNFQLSDKFSIYNKFNIFSCSYMFRSVVWCSGSCLVRGRKTFRSPWCYLLTNKYFWQRFLKSVCASMQHCFFDNGIDNKIVEIRSQNNKIAHQWWTFEKISFFVFLNILNIHSFDESLSFRHLWILIAEYSK